MAHIGQLFLLVLRWVLNRVVFAFLGVADCLLADLFVSVAALNGQVQEAASENCAHNELGAGEPDVHSLLPRSLHVDSAWL